MGYRKPVTLFTVTFDETTKYPGFEFTAKGANIAQLLVIADLRDGAETIGPDNVATVRTMYETFGNRLVSWNLTDDNDQPIECTAEQLGDCEHLMVLDMVAAWMDAVQGVVRPLPNASADGATSTLNGSQPPADLELTMMDPARPPS